MDFATARLNMVESQVRPNKVTDTGIIASLEKVARERFVPEQLQGIAYVDQSIPVAEGRFLMEPMVFARLLQAALPGPRDIALDIACGSGYGPAVLARLVETVVGLESDEALVAQGNEVLNDLGVDNAVVVRGELRAGYSKQGPYNVILIEGAVSEVPEAITDQLADNGRLVAVVIDERGLGRATVIRKVGELLSQRVVFDANVKALPEFAAAPAFVF